MTLKYFMKATIELQEKTRMFCTFKLCGVETMNVYCSRGFKSPDSAF